MTTIAHQAVTTSDAPAPVGPYNQAVQAGGWLYCSGQIPLDPASGEMVGNGDVDCPHPVVSSMAMLKVSPYRHRNRFIMHLLTELNMVVVQIGIGHFVGPGLPYFCNGDDPMIHKF